MANKQSQATNLSISMVFPWPYQLLFMILEPGILLLLCMPLIILNPADHYLFLAPSKSTGPLYTFSSAHPICGPDSAWNTPQLRALWYVLIAAYTFSGIVEPLLLYTARYRLRDARDVEEVVKAVLISLLAFDALHVVASTAVSGFEAAVPWSAQRDIYSMVNVWVPVVWGLTRLSWLSGIGRAVVPHEKVE